MTNGHDSNCLASWLDTHLVTKYCIWIYSFGAKLPPAH